MKFYKTPLNGCQKFILHFFSVSNFSLLNSRLAGQIWPVMCSDQARKATLETARGQPTPPQPTQAHRKRRARRAWWCPAAAAVHWPLSCSLAGDSQLDVSPGHPISRARPRTTCTALRGPAARPPPPRYLSHLTPTVTALAAAALSSKSPAVPPLSSGLGSSQAQRRNCHCSLPGQSSHLGAAPG